MAHLEVINLRCFDRNIGPVISRFLEPVLKAKEVKQNWDITIYQHYRMSMELIISIVNKTETTKPEKSDFGLRMADNLKSFGAVNHTVWKVLPL